MKKGKIDGKVFLLIITIVLFAVMYLAGILIFQSKGFAKPQVFLNLFISNAGLIVIAAGMTMVMITGGIDISVGSVVALTCMMLAWMMEVKGAGAGSALLIFLFYTSDAADGRSSGGSRCCMCHGKKKWK